METGLEQADVNACHNLVGGNPDTVQTANVGERVQGRRHVLPPLRPDAVPLSPIKSWTGQRKRKNETSANPPPTKCQRSSKGGNGPKALPRKVIEKARNIAPLSNIIFMQEKVWLSKTSDPQQRWSHQNLGQQKPPLEIESRRERMVMVVDWIVHNKKSTNWTKIMRICGEAEFFGQYLDERGRFDHWKEHRDLGLVLPDGADENTPPPSHPLAEYVDLYCSKLFGQDKEVESPDTKRQRAIVKRQFENEVFTKERWVRINRRFGMGGLAFITKAISKEW